MFILTPYTDFEVFEESYDRELAYFKYLKTFASEVDFLNEYFECYKMLVEFVDGDYIFNKEFDIFQNDKPRKMSINDILMLVLTEEINIFLKNNYESFIRGFPFLNEDLENNRYSFLRCGVYENGFGIWSIDPLLVYYILNIIFIDYGRIEIHTQKYNEFKYNVLKICRFIKEKRINLINNYGKKDISRYITLFDGNIESLNLADYLIKEFDPTDGRSKSSTKYNQIYHYIKGNLVESITENQFKSFIQDCYDDNYNPTRISPLNQNHQIVLKNFAMNYKNN